MPRLATLHLWGTHLAHSVWSRVGWKWRRGDNIVTLADESPQFLYVGALVERAENVLR
jgi:hypothetical protein